MSSCRSSAPKSSLQSSQLPSVFEEGREKSSSITQSEVTFEPYRTVNATPFYVDGGILADINTSHIDGLDPFCVVCFMLVLDARAVNARDSAARSVMIQ